MSQTTPQRPGLGRVSSVYASIAAILTAIFLVFGIGYSTWLAFAIPLGCLLLAFRWQVFAYGVPISIFGCLLMRALTNFENVSEGTASPLALTAGIAIMATWRLHTSLNPVAQAAITTHVNYVPARRSLDKTEHLTPTHATSCILIVIGWFVSGMLCKKLIEITADERAYEVYAELLKARVGLIPEAYLGMNLLFAIALVFWVAWTCFSYLQLRQRRGSVAGMHLRGELWKWNGAEQRSISRQLRKNETKR